MTRVGRGSLPVRALRFHAGQMTALFLLSVLAVVAGTFGPLYGRAVEAAELRATLQQHSIDAEGLSITAGTGATSTDGLLPNGQLARFYGKPVTSARLPISVGAGATPIETSLVYRDGMCQHLRIVAGHCPSSPGEVIASTSSAKVLGVTVGTSMALNTAGVDNVDVSKQRPRVKLHVVGLYLPFDARDSYWFDRQYASAAGITSVLAAGIEHISGDALFAPQGFEHTLRLPAEAVDTVVYEADVPLSINRVGLDDMASLRRGIADLAATVQGGSSGANVVTSLGALLDEADRGRHQARIVVPAFAAELALLLLVVVGIVTVAAADRRQMEFGLARMRGRSRSRAAALFARPVGGLLLAGVVPGLVLGWLACALACRWWLAGRASPEMRWPVLAAAFAIAAVEVLVVTVVARRVAGRPVQDLLRRVPRRVPVRGVTALEAGICAAAIGGTVVVLSGDQRNVLAALTPGLIALALGLILSRVVDGAAHAAGRRALWRGRLGLGLAGLQAARRPGMRRAVALVCVATALIVSAADQWRVASRNRSVRASVEVGAPVVLTAQASSADALRAAVRAADPTGRYATPVVLQQPPSAPPVLAVEPAEFGRLAGWGWPADRPPDALLSRLDPARPTAPAFTGSEVQLHLATVSVRRQGHGRTPVYLMLRYRLVGNGQDQIVRLGPLPEDRSVADLTLRGQVACTSGCRLTEISLLRDSSDTDTITLDATIAGVRAGTGGTARTLAIGKASAWTSTTEQTPTPSGEMSYIDMSDDAGGLRLSAVNSGQPATLQHLSIPVVLPALQTPGNSLTPDQNGYLPDSNIDGLIASYRPVGSIPVLPGGAGPGLLVDLDVAALTATPTLASSTPEVWLGRDDPARERALVATLAKNGVHVLGRDSVAAHRVALAASAPAWAMQVALVSALLAVLIGALVIFVTASTSRRERRYDAAALRLVGVGRATLTRAAALEQVVVVIAACVIGAAAGVVSARLALPSVPFFVSDVPAPPVRLPEAWGAIALAAVLTLTVLGLTGAAVGAAQTRRAGADRTGEARP